MPIDNTLMGVWKVVSITIGGVSYPILVDSYSESANQNVSTYRGVIGTALPRVLNISGAQVTVNITAPLLVGPSARSDADDINDGLFLWDKMFDASFLTGDYQADPMVIMTSASFSCNANQGARYTFNLIGDANAFGTETGDASSIVTLEGWSGGNPPADVPLEDDSGPYRVASFYDIIAVIGGVTGYVESITMNLNAETDQTAYVGSPDQRFIFGIGSVQLTIEGSMISYTRSPAGVNFGWQAVTDVGNFPATPAYEGIAGSVTGSVYLALRAGTPTAVASANLLPGLASGGVWQGDLVFNTSSLNVSSGFLRTNFRGTLWFNRNTFIS